MKLTKVLILSGVAASLSATPVSAEIAVKRKLGFSPQALATGGAGGGGSGSGPEPLTSGTEIVSFFNDNCSASLYDGGSISNITLSYPDIESMEADFSSGAVDQLNCTGPLTTMSGNEAFPDFMSLKNVDIQGWDKAELNPLGLQTSFEVLRVEGTYSDVSALDGKAMLPASISDVLTLNSPNITRVPDIDFSAVPKTSGGWYSGFKINVTSVEDISGMESISGGEILFFGKAGFNPSTKASNSSPLCLAMDSGDIYAVIEQADLDDWDTRVNLSKADICE